MSNSDIRIRKLGSCYVIQKYFRGKWLTARVCCGDYIETLVIFRAILYRRYRIKRQLEELNEITEQSIVSMGSDPKAALQQLRDKLYPNNDYTAP